MKSYPEWRCVSYSPVSSFGTECYENRASMLSSPALFLPSESEVALIWCDLSSKFSMMELHQNKLNEEFLFRMMKAKFCVLNGNFRITCSKAWDTVKGYLPVLQRQYSSVWGAYLRKNPYKLTRTVGKENYSLIAL